MPILNHIDVVKNADLELLLAEREGPCLSVFMPTRQFEVGISRNPIQLNNLIAQAKVQLKETDCSNTVCDELLLPIKQIQENTTFWQTQGDGLAIFSAPGLFAIYRLPLVFDKLVKVGDCFHIKPLLPLYYQRFFILTLSFNQVRLFQATYYNLTEIPLEGIANKTEIPQLDDPQSQSQFGTSTSYPSEGVQITDFPNHVADEDRQNDILNFCRQVNQSVTDVLDDDHAPLVLVGLDYLHRLYRQANTYPHLIDKGIEGNPEELEPEDYHAHAWIIAKSYLDMERAQAASRYEELQEGDDALVSGNPWTVLPEAYSGQVDTLFVARGIQLWGTFDARRGDVVGLHFKATPDNEDLLDRAAAQTIVHGGKSYVVERTKMPGETPIAAIFRD
jgi:hypothetical protein